VVTWESRGQVGDYTGVFVRIYDAAGNPLTDEIPANTTTECNQYNPSVAGLSDGGFVVVWRSCRTGGSGSAIVARRFDADGSPLTTELVVNTNVDYNPWNLSVAGLSVGGFVVAWESEEQIGSDREIFTRVFDASGSPLTSELTVSSTGDGDQMDPSVSGLSDGRFVVAWESEEQSGSGGHIVVRVFDADGGPLTPNIPVHTTSDGDQRNPSVIGSINSGFVVVWRSSGFGFGSYSLAVRLFDSNGNAAGDPFFAAIRNIVTYTNPSAIRLGEYKFSIVWLARQFGADDEIIAQIHTTDTDQDDDGISDALEDADHSGTIEPHETDPFKVDTDEDGIQDGTELGITLADIGPDTDPRVFIPDLDPLTMGDPTNPDRDGDGLPDGVEDTNANDRQDHGETDPFHMAGDLDGNGEANLADVIAIFQLIAGKTGEPGIPHPGADMNGDDSIDFGEAVFILQRLSGIRP